MLTVIQWLVLGVVGFVVSRLHLGLVNDGSPGPDAPYAIAQPQIAQAIYGRLDSLKPVDHYALTVEAGTRIRAIMLIPSSVYDSGLRAHFTLFGDGLPAAGLQPAMGTRTMTIAGRDYVMTQSYNEPLPTSGMYRVEVRWTDGVGAYCFCVGDQEGGHADAAMRAQIEALIGD